MPLPTLGKTTAPPAAPDPLRTKFTKRIIYDGALKQGRGPTPPRMNMSKLQNAKRTQEVIENKAGPILRLVCSEEPAYKQSRLPAPKLKIRCDASVLPNEPRSHLFSTAAHVIAANFQKNSPRKPNEWAHHDHELRNESSMTEPSSRSPLPDTPENEHGRIQPCETNPVSC